MTIREALDSMKSVHEAGIPSDDSLYSNRRMYSKLLRMRAELIFQKINKKQTISVQDYQYIPCLKMIPVPLIECPCVPKLGTYVLRSETPLPRFLVDISGLAIESVTTLDGKTDFSSTTWEDKTKSAGRKYTGAMSDYYIRNNYLWITNDKTPEIVTLNGLFEDPLDAYAYPSACCEENTEDCMSNLDREFPIDRGTFNAVMELLKKEMTELKSANVVEDTVNNSMSDTSTIK